MTPQLITQSIKPRYRINAVAEMIGVSAANLRAWERRYGIPKPERGNNSYRLYSDQDVNLLKLMKSLCEAGHAPSNAASIALSKLLAVEEPAPKIALGLQDMKSALIESAVKFDSQEIDRILARAIVTESAWTIYQEVIEPALYEIGDLWEKDQSFLANEHLLTHSIKGVMAQLLKVVRPPKPRKKVLFACVSHELHDIPLYALALRASHLGCLPIIIGANTPPTALKAAVTQIKPDIIALSATTALSCIDTSMKPSNLMRAEITAGNDIWVSRSELIASLKRYQQACGENPWMIGGQSELTWSELPLEIKSHVCSDKDQFDLLLQ